MTVCVLRSIPSRPAPCFGAPHMVSSLLDRDADERAVLDPAAVVVLDVGLAQQLAENEPGVARALADPAVGDGRPGVVVALLVVELGQLLVAQIGRAHV